MFTRSFYYDALDNIIYSILSEKFNYFSSEIFCLFWIMFLIGWGSLYSKIYYTEKNFRPEKVFLVSFWLTVGVLLAMTVIYFLVALKYSSFFYSESMTDFNKFFEAHAFFQNLNKETRAEFIWKLSGYKFGIDHQIDNQFLTLSDEDIECVYRSSLILPQYFLHLSWLFDTDYTLLYRLRKFEISTFFDLNHLRSSYAESSNLSNFLHLKFYWIKTFICILAVFLLDSYSKTIILKKKNFLLLKYTTVLFEYPIFFLLSVFMCNMLLSATHLILVFLIMIGLSLSLYALIAFDKNVYTIEAATKYFTAGALSSGLLLFGFFSFYYSSQTLFINSLDLFSNLREENINYFNFLGLISFFLGIFFKLSIFPCHLWAPDVYDGSSFIVTGFLMTIVKIAIFFFLIYFLLTALKPLYFIWSPVFIFSGFISVITGTFGALYQNRLKRFLAFTSMSQLGLSLMTLGLFFENTILSVLFSVFNFLIYILTSLTFFLILFRGLTLNKKPLNNFENIQFSINELGQFNSHFSFLLTLNILSMAGIPPLLGFFSKYLILSLFCVYSPLLVLLLLLLHIVNTFNYLRLVQIIWFKKVIYFFYFNLIFFVEDYKEEYSYLDCLTLLNIFLVFKLELLIENLSYFFM